MRRHAATILKIASAVLTLLLALRVWNLLSEAESLTALRPENEGIQAPGESGRPSSVNVSTAKVHGAKAGESSEGKTEEGGGGTQGTQEQQQAENTEEGKPGKTEQGSAQAQKPQAKVGLPPLPEKLKLIAESGIFGRLPEKRSPPPALLGVAGRYVFLRAPGGQINYVAEGGEVGGVKVLRIGINRVLVEYQGKQQELTIFSGLGSKSLLPQGKAKK